MAAGLKEVRQESGYKTAKDLADALGVAGSTLTRYEKEPESIPMKAAIRIADMLGPTRSTTWSAATTPPPPTCAAPSRSASTRSCPAAAPT